VFRRDPSDGSYQTDSNGNRILYADFDRILGQIDPVRRFRWFKWMAGGGAKGQTAWSVPIQRVVSDPGLTLDPKRFSEKASRLRDDILKKAALPAR